MYVFFRPCNQENAIIFLIMLVGVVVIFSMVKGEK